MDNERRLPDRRGADRGRTGARTECGACGVGCVLVACEWHRHGRIPAADRWAVPVAQEGLCLPLRQHLSGRYPCDGLCRDSDNHHGHDAPADRWHVVQRYVVVLALRTDLCLHRPDSGCHHPAQTFQLSIVNCQFEKGCSFFTQSCWIVLGSDHSHAWQCRYAAREDDHHRWRV